MMLSNSKVVNTSEDKKKKYASFRVSREKFDIKL